MTMWRGQVALVTGGARGIGRAIARLLAERGAAVCVNYAAHAVPAEALVAEIMDGGGRAIAAMADVAEKAAVEAMVARTQKELGPVTILVNNAGISWRGTPRYLRPGAGCADASGECGGINQRHAIGDRRNAIKAVWQNSQSKLDRRDRHSLARQRLLCSNQGRGCDFDQTLRYGAWPSQHYRERGSARIRRTDMTQQGRGADNWQATEEAFAAKAMMGRIGEPEDIAHAVAFLASPEAGWITAQVLTVDGGRMDYIGHA